ncbi:MAG TPA: hypothetical protein VHF01_00280 [Candidatus Acidoferrum sp.]|nr:hypothetical protein [Candidatus Acidoferrum sp.]
MNCCRRAAIAAFFVLALFSPAWAQDSNPPSLRAQADAGDAKAQFALANHYFHGREVPQDYAQALIWYRQASDQGFAPAQNQLGNM